MTYNKRTQGKQFLSPHFQVWEFASSYSDTILIEPSLIERLEQLYVRLNCSRITINSGYRTPAHSIRVGGYANDDHTKGIAADFKCYDSKGIIIPSKVVCITLEDMGVIAIGYINANSTHLSVRTSGKWFGDESKGKSFSSFYTYFGIPKKVTIPVTQPIKLGVGSKVKISLLATRYATGQFIPLRYKNKPYTILQVKNDRVLLKELMSWVLTKDVK